MEPLLGGKGSYIHLNNEYWHRILRTLGLTNWENKTKQNKTASCSSKREGFQLLLQLRWVHEAWGRDLWEYLTVP